MFDLKSLPPLTVGLLVASLLVAVASELGSRNGPIEALFFSWYRIQEGEVWRLITPVFIHFGIVHFAVNSIMTYQLGASVEEHKCIGHMAAFVLVAAALPNLAQYFASGSRSFGGLSGIGYALFAYIWMQALFNRRNHLMMDQSFVILWLGWFVLCWTGLVGNIANWAHAGGLVVGLVWGFVVAKLDGRPVMRR